jgi:hypothetical protein
LRQPLSNPLRNLVPILLAAVAGTPGVLTAAGLTGAGIVKGTIYDAVKEELLSRGQDEATAEAKAQEAQAYGGKNLDMILAGTVLGMVAGRTGAERLILNRIATKAAAKEAATAGAVRRGFAGAIEEGAPEFVQAAQERLAENIALQREGFDVPTMRGVVGAGALEGITGGVLGGGIGACCAAATYPTTSTNSTARSFAST